MAYNTLFIGHFEINMSIIIYQSVKRKYQYTHIYIYRVKYLKYPNCILLRKIIFHSCLSGGSRILKDSE